MRRITRKQVIRFATCAIALAVAIVLLLYAELRWTAKHYTVSRTAPLRQGRSLDTPLALRAVFLNTHLLPLRLENVAGMRTDGLYRATRIAEELSDYDLIGLCEAFDPKCLELIVSTLQKRSNNAFDVISSPMPPKSFLLGGGCVLLCKYPIQSAEAITYSTASSFWNHGFYADGFAAKGAILARIELPVRGESRFSLNCVVTHLEARSPNCRATQIRELADVLPRWFNGEPVIVMGDLNTAADDDQAYAYLRTALTIDGDRLLDAWEELGNEHGGTSDPVTKDGGARIDYILYSPGHGVSRLQLTGVSIRQLRNQRVGSLSDHAAVEAGFIMSASENE